MTIVYSGSRRVEQIYKHNFSGRRTLTQVRTRVSYRRGTTHTSCMVRGSNDVSTLRGSIGEILDSMVIS